MGGQKTQTPNSETWTRVFYQPKHTRQIIRVHAPLVPRVRLHEEQLQVHQLAESDGHFSELVQAFGLGRNRRVPS